MARLISRSVGKKCVLNATNDIISNGTLFPTPSFAVQNRSQSLFKRLFCSKNNPSEKFSKQQRIDLKNVPPTKRTSFVKSIKHSVGWIIPKTTSIKHLEDQPAKNNIFNTDDVVNSFTADESSRENNGLVLTSGQVSNEKELLEAIELTFSDPLMFVESTKENALILSTSDSTPPQVKLNTFAGESNIGGWSNGVKKRVDVNLTESENGTNNKSISMDINVIVNIKPPDPKKKSTIGFQELLSQKTNENGSAAKKLNYRPPSGNDKVFTNGTRNVTSAEDLISKQGELNYKEESINTEHVFGGTEKSSLDQDVKQCMLKLKKYDQGMRPQSTVEKDKKCELLAKLLVQNFSKAVEIYMSSRKQTKSLSVTAKDIPSSLNKKSSELGRECTGLNETQISSNTKYSSYLPEKESVTPFPQTRNLNNASQFLPRSPFETRGVVTPFSIESCHYRFLSGLVTNRNLIEEELNNSEAIHVYDKTASEVPLPINFENKPKNIKEFFRARHLRVSNQINGLLLQKRTTGFNFNALRNFSTSSTLNKEGEKKEGGSCEKANALPCLQSSEVGGKKAESTAGHGRCERFCMPCCKPARDPPTCFFPYSKLPCKKNKTPRPSFSECKLLFDFKIVTPCECIRPRGAHCKKSKESETCNKG